MSSNRYVTAFDTVVELDSLEGTDTGPRYLLYTR